MSVLWVIRFVTCTLSGGTVDLMTVEYSNGINDASPMRTVMSGINSTTLLSTRRTVNVEMTISSGRRKSLLRRHDCAQCFPINSDYNYIRNGAACEPAGPEPIPAGVCTTGDPEQTYMGSSGWRKIPGNTCVGGIKKDEKTLKKCAQGAYYTLRIMFRC